MNNLKIFLKKIPAFFSALIILGLLNSCGGLSDIWDPADARKVDPNVNQRVKKNLEEGRGLSLEKMIDGKDGGGTNYQFASSNPMWRASLEILDFLPLTTVDYSGGMIISDWYSDTSNQNESIKITIRFLSNDIQTGSLKILVHKKTCIAPNNCLVKKIKSKIEEELQRSILGKAALIEKEDKKNKK